jgi:Transposase, Mutator family
MSLTTSRRSIDRARVLRSGGFGGEPLGETPATSSEILQGVPDDLRGKLSDDVVDELLSGASTEQEIVGPGGLLSQLTKRLVERALEVEITGHVGYGRHQEPPGGAGNTRNGSTAKRLITEHGEVPIDTPRDRDGSFSPKIVKKRQRRLRGLTTRSSRSIAVDCRRGILRRISLRSTACTSAGTSLAG